MKHIERLLVLAFATTLTSLATPSQQPSQRKFAQQEKWNLPPVIKSFTSSATTLDFCPWSGSFDSVGYLKTVTLGVIASDPNGDRLSYKYSVTAGRITAKGDFALWDVRKLPQGLHKATTTVTDGRGGKASKSLSLLVETRGSCHTPPCPIITASCPIDQEKRDLVNFESQSHGSLGQ